MLRICCFKVQYGSLGEIGGIPSRHCVQIFPDTNRVDSVSYPRASLVEHKVIQEG